MGEIDKSDQILCAYLAERKLLQLTKKIIFNLLMRLVMNSYILYKLNTQKALNWQDYLIEIIESLASEWKNIIFERQNSQQTSSAIKILLGKKEKDCCVYSNRKKPEIGRKRKQRFALNVTKAYLVLAWASINVNKYVVFCYLQIVFALLEGYISDNGIENTNFLCSFWLFVRFQGGIDLMRLPWQHLYFNQHLKN